MKVKTTGLVLKTTDIRDNDKVLTVLSPDFGLMSIFANGIRKIGHRNAAACSPLCFSEFTLNRGSKGAYTVTEANVNEMFYELRSDILKLSVAQYIAEICMFFSDEGDPAAELLQTALNCLYCLANKKVRPVLVKAVAELRIASQCGYMPSIDACNICGTVSGEFYFNINDGVLVCKNCLSGGAFVPVNGTVLAAMNHIIHSEPKRLFSFKIPKEAEKRLSDLTEKYLREQTEHRFKMPDFIRSLEITPDDITEEKNG